MFNLVVKTYLKGLPGAIIIWKENKDTISNINSCIFNDNKDHAELVFLDLSNNNKKLILNPLLNVKPFQQN